MKEIHEFLILEADAESCLGDGEGTRVGGFRRVRAGGENPVYERISEMARAYHARTGRAVTLGWIPRRRYSETEFAVA
jgi:hypothetical protein